MQSGWKEEAYVAISDCLKSASEIYIDDDCSTAGMQLIYKTVMELDLRVLHCFFVLFFLLSKSKKTFCSNKINQQVIANEIRTFSGFRKQLITISKRCCHKTYESVFNAYGFVLINCD